MGMAPDELVVDRPGDVMDVESLLLGGDLRVEDDLEEQVPQFVPEVAVLAVVQRVQHLVGLLDQVRPQGLVGLFPVPGTASLRPEFRHDVHEFFEGGHRRLRHMAILALKTWFK